MKKKELKVLYISKETGIEKEIILDLYDFQRLGRHLNIKPGEVFQMIKKGIGIQTDFAYYEKIGEVK